LDVSAKFASAGLLGGLPCIGLSATIKTFGIANKDLAAKRTIGAAAKSKSGIGHD
jgi:hypothetical protein